jgi:formylglycine-generating enzyme required for sulfatase activity
MSYRISFRRTFAWRIAILAASAILFAAARPAFAEGPAAPAAASGVPLGLVQDQPKQGPYVKTARGFMVPYSMIIPGTTVQVEMMPIPGGKFKMGSSATEKGRKPDEGPQFEVEVEPFWIGKYPVTWGEYREFMNLTDLFKGLEGLKPPLRQVDKSHEADAVTAPSNLYDPTFTFRNGQKPRQPAVTMSQYAAKQYTKWLSLLTSQFYRLPSEAEWEYACRAGTTTAYFFGDDPKLLGKYGWYFDNSTETTHEVGLKAPNPWGLYDMCGNVSQWVLDEHLADGYKKFAGKTVTAKEAIVWPTKLFPRVLRGGSWDSDAADCRSAARRPSDDVAWREIDPNIPKSPWWFTEVEALSVGMRIMRSLSPPADADRAKYWEPDLQDIAEDANDRLHQGRGARGIVDSKLPEDKKRLEQSSKH